MERCRCSIMSHPSNGKKTEVSAELIRFPSSLWTPWVFHTSVVVCDHESFMYLKRLPTAYDSWGSNWPLAQPTATTQNSCPTMLISPERFHPKHAVILATKKKLWLSALRQSASPMWRDLNQSCDGKMIIFQTNWQRKLPRGRVKNKNTQVSNVKAGNYVARRVDRVLDVFFWLQKESVSKLAGGSKGNATP